VETNSKNMHPHAAAAWQQTSATVVWLQ